VLETRRISPLLVGLLLVLGCTKSKDDAGRSVASGPLVPELGWATSSPAPRPAPISLTASDGSGLQLVSIEARSVIEDPLAFTELRLVFRNPEPRRREGRFEIALPASAAISRFAMRVGGELQEGEVVEKRRAQQTYEEFLHRKQDPALLEKGVANQFSARVFPIEGNADKELIVAYSEELTRRDQPYRLLLGGLPSLSTLKVEVLLGSSSASGAESSERSRGVLGRLTLEKHGEVPAADLEVRLPASQPFALRSGDLVVARVRPKLDLPEQKIDALSVLFDTSASRALGYSDQIERFAGLLAELVRRQGKDFDLLVLAFDQDAEEIYRGPASGFALREKGRLLARGALGASDLERALARLSGEHSARARALIVSDCVTTAGASDTTRLKEAVAQLSAHGLRRLDVLAEGGIQDADVAFALSHAGLAGAGLVLDAGTDVATLAGKLLKATRERVEVHVAGASWVYPEALEGVQSGDERLVFAQLPSDTPLQIELSGAGTHALEALEAPAPLLRRAWARAKIAALTQALRGHGHAPEGEQQQLEAQIVGLSVEQRVLSEFTALLVLETEWDYQRFGIERNALSSILAVGRDGLELQERTQRQLSHDDKPFEERRQEIAAPEPPTSAAFEGEAANRADLRGGAAQARGVPSDGLAAAKKDEEAPGRAREQREASRMASAPSAEPMMPAPAPAKASAGPALDRAPASERAKGISASALEQVLADRAAPAAPPATARSAGGLAESDATLGRRGLGTGGGGGAVVAPVTPQLAPRAIVALHSAEGLANAQAAPVLRGSLAAHARACYARTSQRDPAGERLTLVFSVSDKGGVDDVYVAGGNLADAQVRACIVAAARQLRFPKPDAGRATLQAGLELALVAAAPVDLRQTPQIARPSRPRMAPGARTPEIQEAYDGVLASVLQALKANDAGAALRTASEARERDPGDVVALIALGEALEAQRDQARAARAYGSLIDLFPDRADLRRMAGERLERLAGAGLALAIDSYRKAVALRPDHPSAHRLLAYALLKQGDSKAAFAALEQALDHGFAPDRFEGAERILLEDLALSGAAWLRAEPQAADAIGTALLRRGTRVDAKPSLRFVLNWETDANDVDFHIYDGQGGHAFYMRPRLGSGGALYADVTTGYGPECFTIPGRARAYPYVLQAHYYARGPMGYGMGKLQVVEHDGGGSLRFAEHPFMIMKDKAFVELGRVAGPLAI
jgi:tetratricopeptide (TPR) repeat protein